MSSSRASWKRPESPSTSTTLRRNVSVGNWPWLTSSTGSGRVVAARDGGRRFDVGLQRRTPDGIACQIGEREPNAVQTAGVSGV
jgi:hypothetical protein